MNTRYLGAVMALSLVVPSWAAAGDTPGAPPAPPAGFHMPAPPAMPGMFHGLPFDVVMLAERLDLSSDQREQAGKIVDAVTPKLRALMFRMMDQRKAMEAFREAGGSDEKQLRKLADEQGRITSEWTFLTMKATSDLRGVLNEEQRARLDEMQERRGACRFKGRHHGHGLMERFRRPGES